MIFTDKFVYIHEPKTGGTFVTSVLFRLHDVRWTNWFRLLTLLKPEVVRTSRYGTFIYQTNKHGVCLDIPAAHREKTVLATVRNPLDLYVSQYEFGWWRRREFLRYYRAVPDFDKTYAHFPRLTFAEYVRLTNDAFRSLSDVDGAGDGGVGLMTEQFFKYYFRNPAEALARATADADYVRSGRYLSDMFRLHFVRTDQLNQGLYDFLARMGYRESDLRFILELGKILPGGKGRSSAQKWERYYTPELKREVSERERFLFRVFPEFEV